MMCRRRHRISFRLRRHSGIEIVRLWWANPSTGKTGNNTRWVVGFTHPPFGAVSIDGHVILFRVPGPLKLREISVI
jgi:hypothetical protein